MAEKNSKNRRTKKLGSYPSVSVVVSITLALFMIGLFGLLLIHTNKLKQIVQDNVEVQVYLQKSITESQKGFIEKALASKDYVLQRGDTLSVKFISKEAAAKDFIDETGEDFVSFLGENPLRDAFVINIAPEYQEPQKLSDIKLELEQLSGVFEIEYVESLVETISKNVRRVSIALIVFAAIMVFVVVILINNTIRLALFSQRFLIRSMQLVGATKGFIIKPFLMRASLHGLLAAVISGGLLYGMLNYAYAEIDGLESLRDNNKLLILAGVMLSFGAVLGLISALRAINKYLKLSLDELY